MLRVIFIRLSESRWLRRVLLSSRLAWRVASRFVAASTLSETVPVIRNLNAAGLSATLDHLGERVTSPQEAIEARDHYLALVRTIGQERLQAGISVKLTQLGLELDETTCTEHLRQIVRAAAPEVFVRIDMEHSSVLEATLRVFGQLQAGGADNLGVVIQSYLRRSRTDTEELLRSGTRIRLVKGAYDEPASLAYPAKPDVDQAFDDIALAMLTAAAGAKPVVVADGHTPPPVALGTHDLARIRQAQFASEKLGMPKQALEIQLLFGIRREMGEMLLAEGYPVRIYVPYGTEWYPYFMRRLAERPANLWFFLSNLFRR